MGKAHYKGKDVTEVRSPHRTLLPDTVGPDHQKPTSLQGIANKARVNKQHRFRDLYRCLDAELLLDCWQELNKEAASGVDNVTAEAYGANLHANIEALVQRLKAQRYRAKLVRRCYIPKENGKVRPLGIPALEDKLVQLACAKLLMAIYEQDFLDCSYGYRPGRGALDAVRDLTFDLQYGRTGCEFCKSIEPVARVEENRYMRGQGIRSARAKKRCDHAQSRPSTLLQSPRIFLTPPLSYAAVAFHLGQCEQLLHYRKLAISSETPQSD